MRRSSCVVDVVFPDVPGRLVLLVGALDRAARASRTRACVPSKDGSTSRTSPAPCVIVAGDVALGGRGRGAVAHVQVGAGLEAQQPRAHRSPSHVVVGHRALDVGDGKSSMTGSGLWPPPVPSVRRRRWCKRRPRRSAHNATSSRARAAAAATRTSASIIEILAAGLPVTRLPRAGDGDFLSHSSVLHALIRIV